MVDIGRTSTGSWHVLGKYSCQHAERATLDETKPLDEFDFQHEPESRFVDLTPAEAIRRGVDEAFCKRCARTVNHWLGQRDVYLPNLVEEERVTDSSFNRLDDAPVRSCDGCGKPESATWEFQEADAAVCTTCRKALAEDYTGEGVSIGQFKAGMMDALGGGGGKEPVEAPDWYQRRQRRENPENQRDIAMKEMAEVDGISRHMAHRMYANGFHSVAELAEADPSELTEIGGIGEVKSKKYVRSARYAMQNGNAN